MGKRHHNPRTNFTAICQPCGFVSSILRAVISLQHSIQFHFGTSFRETKKIVIPDLVTWVAPCLISPDMGLPFRSGWMVAAIAMAIHSHPALAATKTHLVTFGKSTNVQWLPEEVRGGDENHPITLKVRPLLLDGRVKEFTLGAQHDVTDRLFVVRRAFRVNDSLPQESASPPRWEWQQGGWILVDRVTGHVTAVNLPEFDPVYSAVGWYRDYAAYCGVSEDGKIVFAVVAEIGRRKAILRKELQGKSIDEGSACATPSWQRLPARVSFDAASATKETFVVRGHAADLVDESEE
jgi:hypothetical protein